MLERGREGTDRQTGRKTVCLTEGERKRETDRPTDGQTDRQADRLPDREREKERDRQTDRQTYRESMSMRLLPSTALYLITSQTAVRFYGMCYVGTT